VADEHEILGAECRPLIPRSVRLLSSQPK
jgi:hypothetical protein